MGWSGGRGTRVGLNIREVIFAFLKKSLLDMEGRENIVLVCAGVFRWKTVDPSKNARTHTPWLNDSLICHSGGA